MRTFAVLAIAAALAGCASPGPVDESYLLEAGSVASLRNPNLAALVRTIGARSPDGSAQRILSDLVHGRKLEPALEIDGKTSACEAAVVRFRGETFVFVALTPWGAPAGPPWLRLFLFDATGELLDHVVGDVKSREGRLDLALTELPGGRLACELAAQTGTKVQMQQGSKRVTLTARTDPNKPVPSASGVVCQVGIHNRKMKLLHPEPTE